MPYEWVESLGWYPPGKGEVEWHHSKTQELVDSNPNGTVPVLIDPATNVIQTMMASQGYARLSGAETFAQLGVDAAEWHAFADSWNDLGPYLYMADGGRYRRAARKRGEEEGRDGGEEGAEGEGAGGEDRQVAE